MNGDGPAVPDRPGARSAMRRSVVRHGLPDHDRPDDLNRSPEVT